MDRLYVVRFVKIKVGWTSASSVEPRGVGCERWSFMPHDDIAYSTVLDGIDPSMLSGFFDG
jgi:hypothetical protein